jgi:chemotaxis protein CheD
MTAIPHEVLATFEAETREVLEELHRVLIEERLRGSPQRIPWCKRQLDLLRGNAESLGLKRLATSIETANGRVTQPLVSQAAIASISRLHDIVRFELNALPSASVQSANVPQGQVYLHPGDLHVESNGARLRTILGSCIAVCLWDGRLKIAGMNHFLLSHRGTQSPSNRFGDVAMSRLISAMGARGSSPAGMQAAVYGGASLISSFREQAKTIGAQNAEYALDYLADQGIQVSNRKLGGTRGMKVIFDTVNGLTQVETV